MILLMKDNSEVINIEYQNFVQYKDYSASREWFKTKFLHQDF